MTTIRIGSIVTLQNTSGSRSYLDTRGRVQDKPQFKNSNRLVFVWTYPSVNRHRGSGSWKIVSAEGKPARAPLSFGDRVHLLNQYPSAGYLDVSLPTTEFAPVQGYPAARTVFTAERPDQDPGSGTWIVESAAGKANGSPVLEDDVLALRSAAPGSGYLYSYGDVQTNPQFDEYTATDSFVFVGLDDAAGASSRSWTVATSATSENPDLDGATTVEYVLEAFGRRGLLKLDGPDVDTWTAGSITLYGGSRDDVTTFTLTNGRWVGREFVADLSGPRVEGTSISAPALRLSFGTGEIPIIGAIGEKSYIGRPGGDDPTSWMTGVLTLALGHEWSAGRHLLPSTPPGTTPAVHATVIFDRTAAPATDPTQIAKHPSTYDYGWWTAPGTWSTPTFTGLTLAWDSLVEELALYRFTDEPATAFPTHGDLDRYRVQAYPYGTINAVLRTMYPKYFSTKAVFADLTALLLNTAVATAPSTIVGISSGGHGSPTGIMNSILDEENDIQRCFGLLKGVRGGRQIDFFDFGTNCNVASLSNLRATAPYARYVLASDLTRNSPKGALKNRPSENYDTYFADTTKDAATILRAMMDAWDQGLNAPESREFYQSLTGPENAAKRSEWKEQLTLFDCSKLATILASVSYDTLRSKVKSGSVDFPDVTFEDSGRKYADFKGAVERANLAYSGFAADWTTFAVKQISNRSTLTWDTDAPKGLLLTR